MATGDQKDGDEMCSGTLHDGHSPVVSGRLVSMTSAAAPGGMVGKTRAFMCAHCHWLCSGKN